MNAKAADRIIHALTAILLSAGIVMPVLGVMDQSFVTMNMLPVCAVIVIVFDLASFHRISAVISAAAAVTGIMIWALSPTGAQTISDLLIAMTLRFRGIETALPVIADPAMIIITCIITFLCCLSCLRKASCIPALILTLAATILVWLTDRKELIPWLLPAFTSLLILLMSAKFPETSRIRILPWAALITAVSFLLAGNGASVPVLKNKADELRQAVLDRLFFTEARDVFSLYSVGFSPQGPDQLGGKPNPDSNPVMKVSASHTVYLRGSVYDEYTGHGWRNSAAGRRYLWQSDRLSAERIRLFDQNLPDESIQTTLNQAETVYIHMLCDGTSTLFVPQRIRELIPGINMVPYFSNSSEVFITRNLKAGDSYSVSAPMFSADEPGIPSLIDVCGINDDPRWNDIPSIYLSLPVHLEQSVFDLAGDITAGAGTPFERALSIRNYLTRNFSYTLDVDEHPENRDFVTEFLMNTRKGYCTYFASAMTVLCRMAGLPARYVEGYRAEPDETGNTIVTGTDAHAWTEVYFKGFGWLVFDPTPGGSSPGNSQTPSGPENTPETSPVPTPGPTPTPEPTPTPSPTPAPSPEPNSDEAPAPSPEPTPPEPSSAPNDTPTPAPPDIPTETPAPPRNDTDIAGNGEPDRQSGRFPWLIIPLILIAVLALRIILTSPSVREKRARTEDRKTDIWIQEVFDLISAENLPRKKSETPLGFAERIDRLGLFTTTIRPVGEIISLIVYSKAIPLPADTAAVRETAVELKTETDRPAKFRYWMRRIFLPAGRRDWKANS